MKKPSESSAMKVPEGYSEISGTRAPIWSPKYKGELIEGIVTEDRVIKTTKGRKKIESRLLILSGDTGSNAIWVSAALKQILDAEKTVKGRTFMIVYEGLRKIKGQGNPMKVFRVFEKNSKAKK
jgi:hypothetical protein